MSITRLPSGRYRAQVYNPATRTNVSVAKVLGLTGQAATFRTKKEAVAARAKAREQLSNRNATTVTVSQWRTRWLTDPLLMGHLKESTVLHYRERTKAFAETYGHLPLAQVDDQVVSQWLAGGQRNATVGELRIMFNVARKKMAGRLIDTNPFAELGITTGKGNAMKQPPDEKTMRHMLDLAWEITPPSFASYLQFACTTAARPGELDALPWTAVNWDDDEVHITTQWNARVRKFTPPKYGPYTLALVQEARQVLDALQQNPKVDESPFVFTSMRGHHYTPSTRIHHWNRVRAAAGIPHMTLYLATRHYFGWYAINVLQLPPHVVAEQLGHKDGGKLVVELYGHPDAKVARGRIRSAHDARGTTRSSTSNTNDRTRNRTRESK